jgi:hypothetical protein
MANLEQDYILAAIQRLQLKIATLEQIQKLTNWRNIRIMFEANNSFKQEFVITDQFTFPFNLETEFRSFIDDSIDHYNRDLETLIFKLKLTEDEK